MLWKDSQMQNTTHGQISYTAHDFLWVEKPNPLFCHVYYAQRISSLVVEGCNIDKVNKRLESNNENQV